MFLLCSLSFRLGRRLAGGCERRPLFDIVYQSARMAPSVAARVRLRNRPVNFLYMGSFFSFRERGQATDDFDQGDPRLDIAPGSRWTWGRSLKIVVPRP